MFKSEKCLSVTMTNQARIDEEKEENSNPKKENQNLRLNENLAIESIQIESQIVCISCASYKKAIRIRRSRLKKINSIFMPCTSTISNVVQMYYRFF